MSVLNMKKEREMTTVLLVLSLVLIQMIKNKYNQNRRQQFIMRVRFKLEKYNILINKKIFLLIRKHKRGIGRS